MNSSTPVGSAKHMYFLRGDSKPKVLKWPNRSHDTCGRYHKISMQTIKHTHLTPKVRTVSTRKFCLISLSIRIKL